MYASSKHSALPPSAPPSAVHNPQVIGRSRSATNDDLDGEAPCRDGPETRSPCHQGLQVISDQTPGYAPSGFGRGIQGRRLLLIRSAGLGWPRPIRIRNLPPVSALTGVGAGLSGWGKKGELVSGALGRLGLMPGPSLAGGRPHAKCPFPFRDVSCPPWHANREDGAESPAL